MVATAASPQAKLQRLSIVVPMYNEVDNVEPFVTAVHEALADYDRPWELIIVNDGSRDGTQQALDEQARLRGPHVRPIHLWRNFRQTAAMQAGIDASRGEVIVTLDGDLQNDPKDIPALVDKLINEDLDLVAGWRQNRQDGMLLRKIPSRIANRLIRRITTLEFQDLGCSLKAYRASVLKRIKLYGEMHRFIPAWMATVTSPARMAEVAVSHHARTRGESKYGISRTLRVVLDLLAVNFFLKFAGRPGHFFGGLGLGVSMLGGAILSYLAVLKLLGESIGGRPLLWLGFFCVLGGLQFLTTGVLAELLIRIYYERGEAAPYHTSATAPSDDAQGWHRPV
ncbi:MAG TPA: glycosyltransferase family 2 protein [Aquabacterium sp.]|uniref:glycosyltransferase family 2 protein n=1 Tax=Aquabacterium sp. TaxID=1872578 RepID=UPI002E3525FD|nr:glycosyltransferase family 2 protein [Aquabacterium sp.]HEX5371152.1 glycosyltransferase family 2 protein [Aquabacterium sp.]